ncbi:FAD binding domain-containing protein [Steroidobacter sp. S1-65]|uniref:FAD binding domain-containing protein n=1 Tax=Steroidobacter gossypii TaxID=2805490 RepID=A0ABS1X3W5_9GAMM|nr:FAD binding domain-containing protein [Steroidobacter gossypii]MBM0107913.1 FAD binding domain-containing protein [Steroidobacter gossypii]
MKSFEWVDARSIDEAAALLADTSPRKPVVAKAGGMDLLDLMKEGIVSPARVINLKSIAALGGVQIDMSGMRLGALVTLAEIERHGGIRSHYRALAEAAAHAATPQVRNAATIGGNLLQRPRCWYFRNDHFHQVAKAEYSEHQHHAIFENEQTVMVHASTLATALLAYDASVHLASGAGSARTVALKEFLLPPSMERERDTIITDGEILTHVSVPAIQPNTRCAYHKQTERDSYDWPICDVAVVLQMKDAFVASAKIVLGWVAPTPRRAVASEEALVGREITEQSATEAAAAAVAAATPLPKNAYKVDVLKAVVKRTILSAR